MQLFSFAWSVLGFDLPLKLSANFCNAPLQHFFCFWLSLLLLLQPLFSTGRNQLELLVCRFFLTSSFARGTLHTLRRAVEKRDLKSFPVIKKCSTASVISIDLTVILTKCFFLKPRHDNN